MILIFQKIIPQYRVSVFQRLQDQLNLKVVYSDPRANSTLKNGEVIDLPWAIKVKRFFYGKGETYVFQQILPTLIKYKPVTVVSEYGLGYASMWILWVCKFLFQYNFLLWTHGIRNEEVRKPFSGVKGKLTLWLFKQCDGLLIYNEDRSLRIREKIGSKPIFTIHNTLDLSENLKYFDTFSQQNLRKETTSLHQKALNLIYVGRLIPEKRIDMMIDLVAYLSTLINVKLDIVGDGPEKVKFDQREDLPIFHHGAIHSGPQKAKLLYEADVLINPGPLGLAVLDAFSLGTPVASLKTSDNGPFHGPEFTYLVDEYNGIIAQDMQTLADRLIHFHHDRSLLLHISENALNTAKENSIERMIDDFNKAFNHFEKR